MKIIKLTVFILLTIILPIGACADEQEAGVIELHSGPVSGKIEDGVYVFWEFPMPPRLSGNFDGNPRRRLLRGRR